MDFSGRLSAFPMAALMQWAASEHPTGKLVVRRSDRQKWLELVGGKVRGCLSDDPAEYYGQYLLLRGYLDPPALVEALDLCRARGWRLGASLVKLGLLDEKRVQETLREQLTDSICDLFLWTHGVFFFEDGLPASEGLLPAPLDPLVLAIEGSRWVDEYQRIRRVFVHDGVTLTTGERWPGHDLDPLAARITDAMASGGEGVRLRDLYARLKGSWFRFLEAAFDLTVADVLAIGEVDDSDDSGEIDDLLLEQATEEQVVLLRNSLSLPVDVVTRLFPLWLGSQGEESSLSAELAARCDGERDLAAILAPGVAERSNEINQLVLALREGRLALLPEPLSAFARRLEHGGTAS